MGFIVKAEFTGAVRDILVFWSVEGAILKISPGCIVEVLIGLISCSGITF